MRYTRPVNRPGLPSILPLAAALLIALPGAGRAEGGLPEAGPAPLQIQGQPPVQMQAPIRATATLADPAAELAGLLHLSEVIATLQDEGADYAEGVEEDLFPGEGGDPWIAQVRALYDPARTAPLFDAAFRDSLSRRDTAPMIAFFGQGIGARAVPLELSARRALLDADVEDDATLAAGEMMVNRDPRFRAISDFVEAGGLIEANVVGGLNANLAFLRGLNAGGGFPEPMAEQDMLDQVAGQEEAIRSETRDWLYAYLTLAYRPLSDGDLADYTAFTRSPPGVQLNEAIFAGFDAVFRDVSYRMGLAAAQRLAGQDL